MATRIKAKATKKPEKSDVKKIWTENQDTFYLRNKSKQIEKLEKGIYTLEVDPFGAFYLERIEDTFKFDYKLYGLETALIERVKRTYDQTNRNLGILLNGVKGTGKTVTAKIMCNTLELPVIIVSHPYQGCNMFLNDIPQDIVIFIDEYEKVFDKHSDDEKGADMLTIMDGALNAPDRRTFILTTNNLHINENLIQRPGRIRYLKTFSDLHPSVVDEIVNDRLKYPEFKKDLVKFISELELITVDIVNSIIDEVNMHQESPVAFKDIFNVKKIQGKHNIYLLDEDGQKTLFKKDVSVYPRKFDGEHLAGYRFEVDNKQIGIITKVLSSSIIQVSLEDRKKRTKSDISPKLDVLDPVPKTPSKKKEIVTLKIEDADSTNWKYASGTYGGYGAPINEYNF